MKLKSLLILVVGFNLVGCTTFIKSTPPLPTIVLDTTVAPRTSAQGVTSGVTASGVVVPAQQAQLASMSGGIVATLNVAEGDRAQAGQTLLRLEGQENLEAAVSAAQLELEQAQQALKDLTTQAETARLQAMQEIVTYEQAVKDAQYTLDNFTVPSNQANLEAVEALNQMKQRLDEARAAFEPYKNRPSSDSTRKDLKEALDQAQADYNAAVKRLQYEYDLEVAESQLTRAQHDYEIYKLGPDPDQVRLAEARRTNAQTKLAAAQAQLAHLTLTAPFAGTISKIFTHSGEWVIPGQPILVLADLDHLRIETTDLSERDVPQIEIGQTATIFIKALNLDMKGHVVGISPLADTLGGDVVYKTTIDLDTVPPGLRAGMSVEVQFGTSQ